MAQVPTVRIVHATAKGGFATINLSDFDPAQHVLFDQRPIVEPTRLIAEKAMLRWASIQDDVTEAVLPGVTPERGGVTAAVTAVTDVSRETPAPRKRGRPRKEA